MFSLNTFFYLSTDLHLCQLSEHRLLLSEGCEGSPSEPADRHLQLQQPQQQANSPRLLPDQGVLWQGSREEDQGWGEEAVPSEREGGRPQLCPGLWGTPLSKQVLFRLKPSRWHSEGLSICVCHPFSRGCESAHPPEAQRRDHLQNDDRLRDPAYPVHPRHSLLHLPAPRKCQSDRAWALPVQVKARCDHVSALKFDIDACFQCAHVPVGFMPAVAHKYSHSAGSSWTA